MYEKIKVKILGLSYVKSPNWLYVLPLSELKGEKRKLPMIISSNELQYIT